MTRERNERQEAGWCGSPWHFDDLCCFQTAARLGLHCASIKCKHTSRHAAKNISNSPETCLFFSTYFYLSTPGLSCSIFHLHCGRILTCSIYLDLGLRPGLNLRPCALLVQSPALDYRDQSLWVIFNRCHYRQLVFPALKELWFVTWVCVASVVVWKAHLPWA